MSRRAWDICPWTGHAAATKLQVPMARVDVRDTRVAALAPYRCRGTPSPAALEGWVSSPEDHEEKVAIPKGTFLLLILFLIVLAGLWANVYLRVVWRA